LSLLGVSAGLRASTSVATVVINACDQVPKAFRYQLQGTMLMAVGLVVSMPFGLVAVAAAQMIVSFYALVPFAFALKLIGLGRHAASQILGPPVIACAAMALTLMALRPITQPALGSAGLLLLLHSLVCAFVYAGVLHLVSRQYLADLLDVIERLRRKER
jgi:hypothetical protein